MDSKTEPPGWQWNRSTFHPAAGLFDIVAGLDFGGFYGWFGSTAACGRMMATCRDERGREEARSKGNRVGRDKEWARHPPLLEARCPRGGFGTLGDTIDIIAGLERRERICCGKPPKRRTMGEA